MKSAIMTATIALTLISLVVAKDIEQTKKHILIREKTYLNYLHGFIPPDAAQIASIKDGLANYDDSIKLEIEHFEKMWKQDGYNEEQVEELVSFFRSSQERVKAALEAAVSDYGLAHAS